MAIGLLYLTLCEIFSLLITRKRRITKEVERKWPRGSVLPNYRNKTEAMEVDKFVEKIVQDETLLFPEGDLKKEAVQETVLKK